MATSGAPARAATPKDLSIYDMVYRCAPVVPGKHLRKILEMEESTVTSPLGTAGVFYPYIREIPMTVDQFGELLDFLRDSDDGFQQVAEWRKIQEIFGAPGGQKMLDDGIVTLRYAGVTEGPGRPIDRHISDLEEGLLDSILGEVYRAIESLFPEVLENIKVFLVQGGVVEQDAGGQIQADDVERVLIELLHPPTLLNRQRGGYYSSFLPDPEYAEVFKELKTDVWEGFGSHCTSAMQQTLADLATHFETVQAYARDFPAETGRAIHDFTNAFRATMEAQATPMQYLGTTLMAFIRKDITYVDYIAQKNF
jgi:hypothetical protein